MRCFVPLYVLIDSACGQTLEEEVEWELIVCKIVEANVCCDHHFDNQKMQVTI